MDLQKIKALIELASQSRLSELELEEGDCRIRLSRGAAPGAAPKTETVAPRAQTVTSSAAPAKAAEPAPPAPKAAPAAAAHTVTAPMFGVFCLKPAPNDPPFVQVGDAVKKGQKLCMLEAMKLFHSVSADRDGKIAEILAANGQEVDAGQALFRIE